MQNFAPFPRPADSLIRKNFCRLSSLASAPAHHADDARRQTDPEDKEFIDPKGAAVKGKGKRVINHNALSGSDRANNPGTLRRLARTRPDLLSRIERGEVSVHAAVDAGMKAAAVMEGAPNLPARTIGIQPVIDDAVKAASDRLVDAPMPTPGPGRGRKTSANGNRFTGTKGQNHSTYLAARLKRDHPEIAASARKAVILAVCHQARELGPVKHGGNRKSVREDQGNNCNLDMTRGNDQTYLARKIMTQSPETFARLEGWSLAVILA